MEQTLRDFFFGPGPIVWFQQLLEPIGPTPFRALSLLGDTWGLLLVVGFAFWFWGRWELYLLLPLIALEGMSYLILTEVFPIPRPTADAVIRYETLSISAFPSGHTYVTTILWGFLYRRDRIPLWVAAAAVIGVAAGRFFLGVHNLGDIVGGILIGSLMVIAYSNFWPRLIGPLRRISWKAYLTAGAAITIAAPLIVPPGDNPRRVAVAAIVAVLVTALPLEAALVLFRACRPEARARLAILLIGLAGLALAFAARELIAAESNFVAAATAGGAALWVLIATPLIGRQAHLERSGSDAAVGEPAARS